MSGRCPGMRQMEWTRITRNWNQAAGRLRQRFPHVDDAALSDAPPQVDEVARHVADRHDLTLHEARREVEDLLFPVRLPEPLQRAAG